MPGQSVLFDTRPDMMPRALNWLEKYKPNLRTITPLADDGKTESDLSLDNYEMVTKYTRLIGRPPIMVAGMTPSTVGEGFVSAVANAGYIVELAGGGQVNEQMFRQRILALTALLKQGESITVNLLFLNPRLWQFQFPMCCQLRKEGYPIEGVTIAAGVPSPEKADEILAAFREAGIMRVGFKPGSVDSIRQVAAIAARNPQTTIVVQWSGGRAGGHHSYEDQHQPMLVTYGLLRDYDNVVLVAGGGIGDAASALPYLTGEWSIPFGYAPMPFDGVMMGSRVMVAKECPTADAVKEMIAKTPGLKDTIQLPSAPTKPAPAAGGKGAAVPKLSSWEDSFEGEAGGILTVLSELGEPIHKIANRGTRFWREMDKRFFSLSKEALLAALAVPANQTFIIDGLNNDFQKPYFPRNREGAVKDVTGMTYVEVAQRMVELMHPHQVGCEHAKCSPAKGCNLEGDRRECTCKCGWLDHSFHSRFREFLLRVVERFHNHPSTSKPPVLAIPSTDPKEREDMAHHKEDDAKESRSSVYQTVLNHRPAAEDQLSPVQLIELVQSTYPLAASTLVSPEDDAFFMQLCRRRGKPVNFVPALDGDIKMWMKKDSLWYSEDLSSVPDHDPERVMVLQGPVATLYASKANEPVKDILDNMKFGLVTQLRMLYRKADRLSQPLASAPTPKAKSTAFTFASNMFYMAPPPALSLPSIDGPVKPVVTSMRLEAPALTGTLVENESAISKWLSALATARPEGPAVVAQLPPRTSNNGAVASWRESLFLVPFMIRNKLWIPNKLRHLFPPRPGQTVRLFGTFPPDANAAPTPGNNIDLSDPVDRILVFDPQTSQFGLSSQVPVVEATWDRTHQTVTVLIRHARSSASENGGRGVASPPAELRLHFTISDAAQYNHELGSLSYMLVEEDWGARCKAIARFYSQLWLQPAQAEAALSAEEEPSEAQDSQQPPQPPPQQQQQQGRIFSSLQYISTEAVSRFRSVIGDPYVMKTAAEVGSNVNVSAPIDYSIVLVWEPMIQSLMEGCDGGYGYSDLLALVHLSNEYIVPSVPVVYTVPTSTPEAVQHTMLAAGLKTARKSTIIGNKQMESAMEMRAGDNLLITSELRSVWDEPEGRVITVQARIFKVLPAKRPIRADEERKTPLEVPVEMLHCVDVVSRFAIRKGGTYKDVEFNSTDEEKQRQLQSMSARLFKRRHLTFTLPLKDDSAVAILMSKKWHTLSMEHVHKDDVLRFELEITEKLSAKSLSQQHKSNTARLDVTTSGTVYAAVCNHRVIDRESDDSSDESVDMIGIAESVVTNALQCPLVAYLTRHGQAVDTLEENAASESPVQYPVMRVAAPVTNVPYAIVSKDVNPIHVNPYAVVLAGLPTTIVHGMYSSAVGRRVAEQLCNGTIKRYKANFTGMVHPGMSIQCHAKLMKLSHGLKVINLEMRDAASGVMVLRASAHALQQPTSYFFTGQGSAAVGMGMELYHSNSPQSAARRVWDEADQFLLHKYGFSILDIVQNNPKRLKISFMGIAGHHIRKSWASLKVHNPAAASGEESYRHLYPGAMDPHSDGIEFYSEEGLLFQTQFQQPAILLTEKSAFEDLRSRGAIIEGTDSRFAGHSLGEYSAIACMVEGRGLSIPALAEVSSSVV